MDGRQKTPKPISTPNEVRRCITCNIDKPQTDEYFYQFFRYERQKWYFRKECRECWRKANVKGTQVILTQPDGKTRKCGKCLEIFPIEEFQQKNETSRKKISWVCRECHNAYQRQYYVGERKEKHAVLVKRRRPKRYGLSQDQIDILTNKYDGMCYICKVRKGTDVDHDHACCPGEGSCGKCVRGILCQKCNWALGLLRDDTQALKNGIKYLENPPAYILREKYGEADG